jgi:hypothetical protein
VKGGAHSVLCRVMRSITAQIAIITATATAMASERGIGKLLVVEGVASGTGAGVAVPVSEGEVPARVTVIDPITGWPSAETTRYET